MKYIKRRSSINTTAVVRRKLGLSKRQLRMSREASRELTAARRTDLALIKAWTKQVRNPALRAILAASK